MVDLMRKAFGTPMFSQRPDAGYHKGHQDRLATQRSFCTRGSIQGRSHKLECVDQAEVKVDVFAFVKTPASSVNSEIRVDFELKNRYVDTPPPSRSIRVVEHCMSLQTHATRVPKHHRSK